MLAMPVPWAQCQGLSLDRVQFLHFVHVVVGRAGSDIYKPWRRASLDARR